MQPGYLPMSPNGDPAFRGSQLPSRINGGQTRATENFFDGAAFGYASGHQGSTESAPPVVAIQEVRVVSTTYSAQYGHTSGGFIEYTSKSGANRLRGSAYGDLAIRRPDSEPRADSTVPWSPHAVAPLRRHLVWAAAAPSALVLLTENLEAQHAALPIRRTATRRATRNRSAANSP